MSDVQAKLDAQMAKQAVSSVLDQQQARIAVYSGRCNDVVAALRSAGIDATVNPGALGRFVSDLAADRKQWQRATASRAEQQDGLDARHREDVARIAELEGKLAKAEHDLSVLRERAEPAKAEPVAKALTRAELREEAFRKLQSHGFDAAQALGVLCAVTAVLAAERVQP